MLDVIKKTIINSIRNVLKNKTVISKALVIPILLLSSAIIFQPKEPTALYIFLATVVTWVIYTMLAVTIHRIILLGPDSVASWGLYVPGGRELEFFFFTFILGLLMIPVAIFAFIPGIGTVVSIILVIYLIGRLSLAFPSIATDQDIRISDSWNATKNYQVLMFVVVGIFPLIISIPEYIITAIPNETLYLFISNIFSLVTMVFIVAALSESYRLIEGQFIES